MEESEGGRTRVGGSGRRPPPCPHRQCCPCEVGPGGVAPLVSDGAAAVLRLAEPPVPGLSDEPRCVGGPSASPAPRPPVRCALSPCGKVLQEPSGSRALQTRPLCGARPGTPALGVRAPGGQAASASAKSWGRRSLAHVLSSGSLSPAESADAWPCATGRCCVLLPASARLLVNPSAPDRAGPGPKQ